MFSVFSRYFGISWFFPVGKYRTFGKILKKTEKHSSLRSTKRVVDVYQVSGIYIHILHTYSHIISIAPEGKCQHPAVDGPECLPIVALFGNVGVSVRLLASRLYTSTDGGRRHAAVNNALLYYYYCTRAKKDGQGQKTNDWFTVLYVVHGSHSYLSHCCLYCS